MAKSKETIRRYAELPAAFLAPVVILAAVFLAYGVYPFGERTIVSGDLAHQYLPIMAELQRSIGEPGGLFYTFNAGLGTDFYALSTYQNASPVTWLFLALFPADKLVLCATLMIMVKAGLISCAMCWYLKKLAGISQGTTCAFARIALSLFYALGAYVLAYCAHIMWLDTLILLPIVVWGLRCAMDKGGAGDDANTGTGGTANTGAGGTANTGVGGNMLYVISLALMLFTNYYTGLMACLFLVFYFFVHYIGERKSDLVLTFARIAALSLLAAAMAAIVLVPTFFALRQTGSFAILGTGLVDVQDEGASGLFYYSIPVHFAQLLPNSPLTILDGPANIYAGLVTIVLLVLFTTNNGIDWRKRIAKSALILFLFASTNVVPLDLFWNFFHVPNMFPGRYAFLLAFMLVEVASESLAHIKTANIKDLTAAFVCVLALYLLAFLGGGVGAADTRFMLFSGVALVVLYGFVLIVMRGTDGNIRTQLLAMVMVFEVVLAAFHGIGANEIVQKDTYRTQGEAVASLLETVEQDDPFARVEIVDTDNSNAPLVYDYKGASVFASSVPESTFVLLNGLMSDRPMQSMRSFTYGAPYAVSDAIANIGYYISLSGKLDVPWLEERDQVDGCYLYESPYHTSVGYLLPEGIAQWRLDAPREEVLNGFVSLATGGQNATGRVPSGQENNQAKGQTAPAHIAQSSGEVDIDAWSEAYPQIFTDLLQVSEMQGNRLAGTIHAHTDGVFMTTIPYSEGWQVNVDGAVVENANAVAAFVSFPLSAGQHTIEMTYTPKGFVLGSILTLAAIALATVIPIRKSWVRN